MHLSDRIIYRGGGQQPGSKGQSGQLEKATLTPDQIVRNQRRPNGRPPKAADNSNLLDLVRRLSFMLATMEQSSGKSGSAFPNTNDL